MSSPDEEMAPGRGSSAELPLDGWIAIVGTSGFFWRGAQRPVHRFLEVQNPAAACPDVVSMSHESEAVTTYHVSHREVLLRVLGGEK